MAKNRQAHTAELLKQADVQELLAIMNELEQAGQTEMLAALSSELNNAKKVQSVAQIQQAAIVTDGKVKTWLVPAISSAYIAGVHALDGELRKFGIKTSLGKLTVATMKTVPDMKPHLDAVNSLLSDAYLDFGSSITGFVRGAEHSLNDALKKQIQSKLALGRLSGSDINTIKKDIVQQLSDRGFKVLLDKGGKQWELGTYSEMLARTHVIKANTEATINRGSQLEIDIYEVSSHGTLDDICGVQEGKLYSVSGKSKNYPRLTDDRTPPFHPNCKHTLLPRPDLE